MMNRGRSRSSGVAWLLALLALALASLASLQSVGLAQADRSAIWDEIDVTVELREDSSFHVSERDRIDFIGGPFRSGYREIPLARIDAVDNVRVGEVTGDTVQPYRYVTPGDFSADVPNTFTYREVGPTLRIEWSFPRTTSQSRTFQIEFDAYGVLRVYDDVETPYQQISWIGVGKEITENAPVNNAILRFVLPRPVDPGRTFIQGPGSERPEDHTEDGQTWTWTASNLGRGDSLGAGLQFEPLVLAAEPSWQAGGTSHEEPKAARFERELLEALFGSKVKSGEQVALSEVKGRFAAAQPQIQRHLYDELVERGYFTTSPERTRGRWKSIGVFALIVAIVGGCIAVSSLADIAPTIFIPIAALVVIGLIVVLIS